MKLVYDFPTRQGITVGGRWRGVQLARARKSSINKLQPRIPMVLRMPHKWPRQRWQWRTCTLANQLMSIDSVLFYEFFFSISLISSVAQK